MFQGLQQGNGTPENPFVFVEMGPDSMTVNSISAQVVSSNEAPGDNVNGETLFVTFPETILYTKVNLIYSSTSIDCSSLQHKTKQKQQEKPQH